MPLLTNSVGALKARFPPLFLGQLGEEAMKAPALWLRYCLPDYLYIIFFMLDVKQESYEYQILIGLTRPRNRNQVYRLRSNNFKH